MSRSLPVPTFSLKSKKINGEEEYMSNTASVNAGPVPASVPIYVKTPTGEKKKLRQKAEAEVSLYGYDISVPLTKKGNGVYCNIEVKLLPAEGENTAGQKKESLTISLTKQQARPYLDVLGVKPEECGQGLSVFFTQLKPPAK